MIVAFQPPETHVQGMVIPVSRLESVAENHPVAERTQVATQALQSQQAAGDGTEPEAGAANVAAAISDGDYAQLVQVWGGQIRRQSNDRNDIRAKPNRAANGVWRQFPAAPTGLNGNAFGFRLRIVFE